MSVWLNARKPPYMDGTESHALTEDHILHAVKSMSYEGLQLCAIGYLLVMNRMGLSPADISAGLESTYREGIKVCRKST